MKTEDLVINLKYAQKLKNIGIKQESSFLYTQNIERYENNNPVYEQNFTLRFPKEGLDFLNYNIKTKLSAFTSEELLEILPCGINISKDDFYYVKYDENKIFKDKKLSNALAKLLLWCVENEEL
jgi:hypothetical protein